MNPSESGCATDVHSASDVPTTVSLWSLAQRQGVLPTTWTSRRRAATTSDLPATSDLPTTVGLVDFAAVGGVVT